MKKQSKADRFKEKIRLLLSFGPKIGLVPKASRFREKGISALIRARNEEYWIRPCILSIKNYVDEILLIDNGSTDSTLDEVESVRNEISTPIRIFSLPEADYCEVSNIGIRESRYSWLLKWDADFIAQTEGPGDFSRLRNYILSLDQDRYHMIFMSLVNLAGDLWHQPKDGSVFIGENGPLHYEAYLWNFSPKLQYVWKNYPGRSITESLLFPPYYRFLKWPEYSVFHVGGIRSIQRLTISHFWDFGKQNFLKGYTHSQMEEIAWNLARKYFNTEDYSEIFKCFFELIREELMLFNESNYGCHPPELTPYSRDPEYRILYDDTGKIAGRKPDCLWFIKNGEK